MSFFNNYIIDLLSLRRILTQRYVNDITQMYERAKYMKPSLTLYLDASATTRATKREKDLRERISRESEAVWSPYRFQQLFVSRTKRLTDTVLLRAGHREIRSSIAVLRPNVRN